MTVTVTPQFVDVVRDTFDIEVRADYSGRGMYGRECFAIVGSAGDLMRFAINLPTILAEDDPALVDANTALDNVPDEWHDVHWDNMAYDMVFYWPSVRVLKSDELDTATDSSFVGHKNIPHIPPLPDLVEKIKDLPDDAWPSADVEDVFVVDDGIVS